VSGLPFNSWQIGMGRAPSKGTHPTGRLAGQPSF